MQQQYIGSNFKTKMFS